MTYPTLKIIHVTGLALVFMGLTGALALKYAGESTVRKRWLFHVAHGVGLILMLASGIGLGSKLGVTHPAPFWVIAKFGVWLLAGSAMILAIRFSRFAGIILIYFAVLVFAATWLAINKPS